MRRSGIDVEGLSFSYPVYPGVPARELLREARLAVAAGALALVLGESDTGKTTLARILGALVPRFTGGTLRGKASVAGADVIRLHPYELVERVGLVFQNPDEQIVTTRCDTEAAFALESLGVPRHEILRRVGAALEMMGLAAFASRNPASLSGGEKKRLLLACLVAIDPEVWVLDEAFEELDLTWRTSVLDEVASRGRTALVTDSRWTPLFSGRAADHFLLRDGELHRVQSPADGQPPRELVDAGIAAPPAGPRRAARRSFSRLLAAEDLRFAFSGGGFSLCVDGMELRRGEVCALLGRNGSGKSTLARILCGLLAPEGGRVLLESSSGLRPASTEALNRTVGYLFQNPDHQIFLPTVREELELGLTARGIRGAAAHRMVGEAVGRFALPGPDTPPALMSYGSRKLLQAATCWLLDREIVILDEADSGLSWRQFLALVDALRGPDTSLLLITHDERLARQLADRTLVMDGGRLVGEEGR